ncbi:MAG: rhomboid family intramembrane serine protease [Pseudomonadota bacterium]
MAAKRSVMLLPLIASAALPVLHWLLGPAHHDIILIRDWRQFEQPWRWLTAHFAHADLEHLFWNTIAATALALLFIRHRIESGVALTLFCVIGVNAGIAFDHSLYRYCGFSGVLNGWAVIVLYQMWTQRTQRAMVLVVATLFAAKLSIEWIHHSALFTDSQWQTVPLAHIGGAVGGAFGSVLGRAYRYRKTAPVNSHSLKLIEVS